MVHAEKSCFIPAGFGRLLSVASGVFGGLIQGREEHVKPYTGTLNDSTELLFEFDNRAKDQARY